MQEESTFQADLTDMRSAILVACLKDQPFGVQLRSQQPSPLLGRTILKHVVHSSSAESVTSRRTITIWQRPFLNEWKAELLGVTDAVPVYVQASRHAPRNCWMEKRETYDGADYVARNVKVCP
jgi:hypothetical protein